MKFCLGPLYIEAGCARRRIAAFWVPCDLHIWLGSRGVHVFAFKARQGRRVAFDWAASKEKDDE